MKRAYKIATARMAVSLFTALVWAAQAAGNNSAALPQDKQAELKKTESQCWPIH
ncbi:hypothetical protein ACI7RC_19410 [Brevibacillus sp. B_LB10_24]|uniref:hypothetical protein n=1 Tax=Brevibacillus sp. B_LB10_24 TaxID=3380645 RepID=UPI0038B97E4C